MQFAGKVNMLASADSIESKYAKVSSQIYNACFNNY